MTTHVGIVGLGVIGGSLALALRRRPEYAVAAYAISPEDRQAARDAGLRVEDTLAALLEHVDDSDALLVLAVPVQAIRQLVPACVASRASILHTAGLQRAEALRLDPAMHAVLLGTHPLAGSHASGFGGARPKIFQDATVHAEERASSALRQQLERLWRAAGAARIEYASADAHDRRMAWISHLPQLASTALAAALASAAESGAALGATGPGARDATRLAASPSEIWRAVWEVVPGETLVALDALEQELRALREAITARDDDAVEAIWRRAREWRMRVDDTP